MYADHLRNLRVSNLKKVIIGHLNINSIPNKLEGPGYFPYFGNKNR